MNLLRHWTCLEIILHQRQKSFMAKWIVLVEDSRLYNMRDPFRIVRKRVGDAVNAAIMILNFNSLDRNSCRPI